MPDAFGTLNPNYSDLLRQATLASQQDQPASIEQLAGIPPQTFMQKLAQTWPARMAQDVYSAATLPGDMYAGRVQPGSDEEVQRAARMAQFLSTPQRMMPPRGAVGIFGGRLAQPQGSDAILSALFKIIAGR